MTTKDLVELIYQNTRIILPEFGAFLVKESSEKGFLPSNLTFSPFLRYNDGMLEVHIAKSKGISKDEASKLVHAFIDNIRNELQDKGVFQIENLGFLKRDSRGSITFTLTDTTKQTKQAEKQAEKQTEKQAEKQVEKQIEKQVEKQIEKQVEKQIEKQIEPVKSEPIIKKVDDSKIPELDEKRDPWADETIDEPRVDAQKKFRRIGGKRAQVEKLTITRIPINKDLLGSSDESNNNEESSDNERVRSMFVPVSDEEVKEEKLPSETVKADPIKMDQVIEEVKPLPVEEDIAKEDQLISDEAPSESILIETVKEDKLLEEVIPVPFKEQVSNEDHAIIEEVQSDSILIETAIEDKLLEEIIITSDAKDKPMEDQVILDEIKPESITIEAKTNEEIDKEVSPKKTKTGRKKKSTKKVEAEIIEKIEDIPILEVPEEKPIESNETEKELEIIEPIKSELIEIEIASEGLSKDETVRNVLEPIIQDNKTEIKEKPIETFKEDLDRDKAKEKTRIFSEQPEERDRSNRNIIIIIGVVAVVVIIFFIGKSLFFNSKTNIIADSLSSSQTALTDTSTQVIEDMEQKEDDIDEAYNELDKTQEIEVATDKDLEKKQKETEEAIKESVIQNADVQVKSGTRYYLIVGSFKNLDYANKFSDKIEKSGMKTEIVLQKSGMHAVSIGAYKTRNEAATRQSIMIDKFPGAWILKQ